VNEETKGETKVKTGMRKKIASLALLTRVGPLT